MGYSVAVYTRSVMAHQSHWHDACIAGLNRHGIKADHRATGDWVESDVAVVWGEKARLAASPYARRVLVVERGFFGSRMLNASMGWDGLNGRADFNNQNSEPDRWKQHGVPVMDWHGGDYVLLLGQVPGDMSHAHTDLNQFYRDALLNHMSKRVVFRPHPLGSVAPDGCEVDAQSSLYDALAGAMLAVTLNSNSGVDAVLSGTPLAAVDIGSMAWDVSSHNHTLTTPDRTQWLNNLAYCQWNEAEVRSGEAWAHLRH